MNVETKNKGVADPNKEFFKEDEKKVIKSDINDPPPAPNVNLTTTYGKAKIKFKRPKDFNNKLVDISIIFLKLLIKMKVLRGLMPDSQCTTCEKVFEKSKILILLIR